VFEDVTWEDIIIASLAWDFTIGFGWFVVSIRASGGDLGLQKLTIRSATPMNLSMSKRGE
jgi:hypothetical protein